MRSEVKINFQPQITADQEKRLEDLDMLKTKAPSVT